MTALLSDALDNVYRYLGGVRYDTALYPDTDTINATGEVKRFVTLYRRLSKQRQEAVAAYLVVRLQPMAFIMNEYMTIIIEQERADIILRPQSSHGDSLKKEHKLER